MQLFMQNLRYCIACESFSKIPCRETLRRFDGALGTSMAELKPHELEGGEIQSGELKDLIDHWIQVIDGWVHDLDQRMGGTATGADPGEVSSTPTDPAPRPAPDAPPVGGAG